jgi:ADP-ribosylglycohydrolase
MSEESHSAQSALRHSNNIPILLKSKILGGIYGQALGDTFCMPALLTPQHTKNRYGKIAQLLPAPDDHEVHHGLPAGRVTDDTEHAMFLARQIIADGRVTIEGAAKAIVAWYDHVGGDTVPFVGPSTRRAVAKIRAGVDLRVTGLGGDTNGAAMRVSVVGLLHPGNIEAAAHDAVLTALPSHNTTAGCASAAAVAAAVACAVGRVDEDTHAPTPPELRDIIFAGMHAANIGAALGKLSLGASVSRRIDLAVSLARDGVGTDAERIQAIFDLVGTSLAASESVPAAFGIVALAEGDPLRAAMLAAELSGDADTIGAIACAICGAWRGVEAIPADMRATICAANPDYDFEVIAESLMQLALASYG